MTELAFRRAGLADAPAILALTRAAYARWVPVIGREPLPMTVDYAVAVEAHRIELLEAQGALAALIEMRPEPDHLFLVNLAVAPEKQGAGLGLRLLARAEDVARELLLPELRLATNKAFAANLRFYAAQGFRIDEERPFLNGVGVYMSRLVAPLGASRRSLGS
jgi:N-acetylglutamate synthase-like GNAT family acetyltransferase